MTVMVRRTWFSRAAWEMKPTSARPGLVVTAGPVDRETAKVAWAKSTATMPLTVIGNAQAAQQDTSWPAGGQAGGEQADRTSQVIWTI